MSANYYEILGVNNQSSKTEIKQAYMSLALKYHPDRNKDENATEQFKKINQAYEILSDEQSKKEYDEQTNKIVTPVQQKFNFEPFIHLFGEAYPIFKTAVHHFNLPMPIIINKALTIKQMYNGISCPIIIKRFILTGENRIEDEEVIYVSFKQGIDAGETVIIEGKGNCINGIYGNIKIIIELEHNNEEIIKRKGMDIIIHYTLTLKQALCGCKFALNHPNGKFVTISTFGLIIHNQASQVIEKFGFIRDGTVGNLILIFNIDFPKELSKESLELIEKAL